MTFDNARDYTVTPPRSEPLDEHCSVCCEAAHPPAASTDALRSAQLPHCPLCGSDPVDAAHALEVQNRWRALAATPPSAHPATDGLDVERLAEAIRNTYIAPSASRDIDAENIVREYARLSSPEGQK